MITIADVKKTIPPKVAMAYAIPTKILEDEEISGKPAPTRRYSDVKYCGA